MSIFIRNINNIVCTVLLLILIVFSISTSICEGAEGVKSKYAPNKISGTYLTDEEFFLLPDFLQIKVRYHNTGNPPQVYVEWNRKMGVDYQHYHHWAAAIVRFHRAMAPGNIKNRRSILKNVLGEYSYLLRHCTADNSFRYIYHLRRGEVFYILKQYSSAAKELQTSISYKKNKQAYTVLGKVYERLGMIDMARDSFSKSEAINQ